MGGLDRSACCFIDIARDARAPLLGTLLFLVLQERVCDNVSMYALSDRWHCDVESKCLYDTEWDVRITESVGYQVGCCIDAARLLSRGVCTSLLKKERC